MIGPPGSPGVPPLRPPTAAEADAIQAVWEASHGADDPGGRPRGGWSVEPWSTNLSVLADDTRIIGIAAIRAEPPEEAISARIALEPECRSTDYADALVREVLDLAQRAHGKMVRLFVPGEAEWATSAATRVDFRRVRTVFHMLLAGSVKYDVRNGVPAGIRIRRMHAGEEPAVLEALNRFWESTWFFVPIRADMLESDLEGQRAGMLLAVDAKDDTLILATCHAVFDPSDHNPDGGPRAWISNLTVHPDQRGRGLGRAMLLAGLDALRARGANSITLGVDAGDPAPLRLYQSVGFETISRTGAWDRDLRA